jgi:hypothetical protein
MKGNDMSTQTAFAAMPAPMVGQWTAWANSHDWGGQREARYDATTGEMVTYGSEHDGTAWATVEARHRTPKAMRDWAGY